MMELSEEAMEEFRIIVSLEYGYTGLPEKGTVSFIYILNKNREELIDVGVFWRNSNDHLVYTELGADMAKLVSL